MADGAIYDETQRMHHNAIVRYMVPIMSLGSVIMVGAIMIGTGAPAGTLVLVVAIGLGLPAAIAFMPMRTVVTEDQILVRTLVAFKFTVPTASVRSAEAITYNPLGDCGGWGLRISRKFGLVLNVAGDRGVRLTHTARGKEKSMLIGSLRSEELARAIRLAADLPVDVPEHAGTPSVAS